MKYRLGPVRKEWDRLRKLYYMDAPEGAEKRPFRPPTAKQASFHWTAVANPLLSHVMIEVSDNETFEVGLNPLLAQVPRLLLLILLHELSHTRLGHGPVCGSRSSTWRAERKRLEGLGAFGEIF